MTRTPAFAGRFYAADPQGCQEQLRSCLPAATVQLPAEATLYGGIVPHAGWTFSGPVAGKVFSALAQQASVDVVVLIGAVHSVRSSRAALFDRGAWQTPLGQVRIHEALARRLLQ